MPERPRDEVRVLLVSEDPLARSGLASLLVGQPGIVVAGQAGGDDLAASIHAHEPDVAALDLGLGAESAMLDRIREVPGLPVLAILSEEAQAEEALAAGARGFVFRDAEPERLAAALRAAARGLVVLDEAVADSLLRPPHAEVPPPLEELTPREREVLQLLAEGLPNKLIAQRLGISDHTAKFHVNAILGKLGAQNRTEAIARAARLGLVIL